MTCPVCRQSDTAYLSCNRPDCTDGRHVPSAPLRRYDAKDDAAYDRMGKWGKGIVLAVLLGGLGYAGLAYAHDLYSMVCR